MQIMRWIAAMTLAAGTAGAEPAVFDLTLRGVPAGALTFVGRETGGRYAVTGRLETGGLAALLRRVRYDAEAEGRVSRGRFTPQRYAEAADTGRRQSKAVMSYEGGVPQVKVYDPPRRTGDRDLDPATQVGTVDPLTALYATLRDVPAGAECNVRHTMFDGQRRSEVALGAPQAVEGGVACPGEYRRLEGFSAKDMAERSRFPFTVRLEPAANGTMRVAEVSMVTLYGNARLTRR